MKLRGSLTNRVLMIWALFSKGLQLIIFCLLFHLFVLIEFSQPMIQPNYATQFQPNNNNNYLRNSSAFRQEIARFEMSVYREGKQPLPLSQVPRVQQGDVIKVKLLDESVNGVKLDQSLYNWTMLAAFVNPNRKFSDSNNGVSDKSIQSDKESSVSQEIIFRKTGWYKEYSFTVPYDSQPLFFLYPRPGYRGKLLNLINKNYKEIKTLGEKTIEIAGAYGQISLFLNELQGVISGNGYYSNGMGSNYYGGTIGGFNNSGIYNPYNQNNNYNRNNYPGYNQQYNYNLFVAQSVERMARAFNISLPNNCWQGSQNFANQTTYNNYYGGYNGFNNTLQNIFQPTISPELVSRLQCVAKNIRLEDFDVSVSKLLQQGGMLLAIQLQQKYPQLSYWINVAALAIDLIVKITRKSPLRIIPSVTSSSDNPNSGSYSGGNFQVGNMPNRFNPSNPTSGMGSTMQNNQPQQMPKVSVFAESQPDDNQFVTAYPIILHKWQPEADAEIISLRPPILAEPCLHAGVNILKSTDLTDAQVQDNFTKDYTLTMTSTNGFKKEFLLKKNIGLNGWEMNITPQDLNDFPKIQMNLESVIKGTRGFNEIKSPPFYLPISLGGSWQISPESQQNFIVGGKRRITIKNTLGNCQCLQAVIYKPSFGGQFVFEANESGGSNSQNSLQYSPDNKEVSFEVDATNFQAGAGEIELRTFGGESQKLLLKLYPLPPNITGLKLNKGDREGIISGERLEQIQVVKINGRRAIVTGGRGDGETRGQQLQSPNGIAQNYPNQANRQNAVNSYISNLQTTNPNERVIVFEDATAKITENTANLEVELEDNRTIQVKQNFPISPSRPMLIANELKEIEGVAIKKDEVIVQNQTVIINGKPNKGQRTKDEGQSQLDLSKLAVFPIDTSEIVLSVQNALTDYDFKVENLSVETRLEKSSANNPNGYNNYGNEPALPKAQFEVLDWKNLQITLQLAEQFQKLLGGRRLQFRLRDKERGDSDWYSIKQTFVRIPNISSITCTTEMNSMCEMKGNTIDYISQISIDSGQTWYPNGTATLQVQPMPDGQKLAIIPLLQNKNMLMIKLRDFPKGDGLFIGNFSFSNTVKNIKSVVQQPQTKSVSPKPDKPTPNRLPSTEKVPLENENRQKKPKKS